MATLKSDYNDKYYTCFPQENTNSCGVASIRMINYYLNGQDIGAAVVRHYVDIAENNRQAGQKLGVNNVIPDNGVHDFATAGITLTTAKATLELLRPARFWEIESRSSQAAIAITQRATPRNPMFVGLRLNGNFWHAVVAVDTYTDGSGDTHVVVANPATSLAHPNGKIGSFETLFGIYDIGVNRIGSVESVIYMRNSGNA